jgi:hypothetical protein
MLPHGLQRPFLSKRENWKPRKENRGESKAEIGKQRFDADKLLAKVTFKARRSPNLCIDDFVGKEYNELRAQRLLPRPS